MREPFLTPSLRHVWRWLSPLCFLLAASAALEAAEPEPAAWAVEGTLDAYDDEALFVAGNTLFAVYHELGHALVDLLDLPVIGKEENAVDGFAAVTMIPETPDEVRDALIVAVGDGWRAVSDAGADRGGHRYWGEHALDEQRHFAVVCLMVGSDQDGFYDYALDAGLPEARIETCADDFAAMKDGWNRLLGPHRPDVQATDGSSSPPIDMVFDQPLPELERAYDLVREGGWLEEAIAGFSDEILLPEPIAIRFSVCGSANAFWSRSQRSVTVCYELVDEFDAILGSAFLR